MRRTGGVLSRPEARHSVPAEGTPWWGLLMAGLLLLPVAPLLASDLESPRPQGQAPGHVDAVPPFPSNVRVAGAGRPVPHQVEPYLVVDSRDRLFIGWKEAETAEGPGWRVGFARSLDHGFAWSAPVLMAGTTPSRGQSDPWLAVDEHDRLYYARLDYAPGGDEGGVVVSRSDDGGETWGPPVDVHDRPHFADKESMVSDGNGTLYLAYDDVDLGTGGISLRVTHSRDGGRTWAPTAAASPSTEGAAPVLAAWPNGTVVVAWWEFGSGDILAATSSDRGGTWTDPVRVNPNPGSAVGMPGSPWAFPLPSVATDALGRLFLAWSEGEGEDLDVLVARSEDRGLHWSAPVRVNDDGSTREQRMASLAVGGRGVLHAAWLDNRSGELHIFYSNSTDGGRSWSPNVRVTTEGTPSAYVRPGDYLGLAADRNGSAYVAWTDGRGEDLDIYFALGDFSPPSLEILLPSEGAMLSSAVVLISGVAEDATGIALVEVSANGMEWEPASGTASWNATLTVFPGTVVLYARATDSVGNVAVTSVSISVGGGRPITSLHLVAFGVGGGVAAGALLWRLVKGRGR